MEALTRIAREDRGRLLAALIARTGDFAAAEDALQEAFVAAHLHWPRSGIPDRPEGWLLRTALRRAIDRHRKGARDGQGAATLTLLAEERAPDPMDIPDDRLRLIFTCCHPALDLKSRVALTLRTIGGLTTPEIARAFLDRDTTMGQRLSRAKAKIGAAGIPFVVPGPEDWAARLEAVLAVIYLIFNAGYSGSPGRDLCEEAVFLARLIDHLRPGEAETEGCLALMLLTHGRRAARIGPDGATVPPAHQSRTLWDAGMIAEGLATLDRAIARHTPGPFQIKAAIASLHSAPPPTDWLQIALLYDSLLRMEPTPVIRLNRAVAIAEAGEPAAAWRLLEPLLQDLAGYQPYHAATADVLARLGRIAESRAAYARAISGVASSADALFLTHRCANLPE